MMRAQGDIAPLGAVKLKMPSAAAGASREGAHHMGKCMRAGTRLAPSGAAVFVMAPALGTDWAPDTVRRADVETQLGPAAW